MPKWLDILGRRVQTVASSIDERLPQLADSGYCVQHRTYVTNEANKEIKVVVQHPHGGYDIVHIGPRGSLSNSRCIHTVEGMVTVALLDDDDDIVEQRCIPSNSSVMVITRECRMQNPQLVRTRCGHPWEVHPEEYAK